MACGGTERLPEVITRGEVHRKVAITLARVLTGAGLLLLLYFTVVHDPEPLSITGRGDAERAVSGLMVEMSSLQEFFRDQDLDCNGRKDYWAGDVRGLYYLQTRSEPLGLITKGVADADAGPHAPPGSGAPKPYSGYFFKALPVLHDADGTSVHGFAFAAYPATWGEWTRHTFIVSVGGERWRKDLEGRVISRRPADPAREGWTRFK